MADQTAKRPDQLELDEGVKLAKLEQQALAGETQGKTVYAIVEDTNNFGDDVKIWVFGAHDPKRLGVEKSFPKDVILMIMTIEPANIQVHFLKAEVRDGRFIDMSGDDVIQQAKEYGYTGA